MLKSQRMLGLPVYSAVRRILYEPTEDDVQSRLIGDLAFLHTENSKTWPPPPRIRALSASGT